MSQHTTSAETKALTLLGQGLGAELVASADGLSVSRISQLLSDPVFAAQVSELRFSALAKHNERDNVYDVMEDVLLEKLKDLIPYMLKPFEVLKAIQIINGAKRRGSSAPESMTQKADVVQLVLPIQIVQQFSLNTANQVIRAGDQELITVQSGRLEGLLTARKIAIAQEKEKRDVLTIDARTTSPA